MPRETSVPWWLSLALLFFGLALCAGAVITYEDQHSGTPGTATVTRCIGVDGRYGASRHCTGTWVVGGPLVGGNGHVVVGEIQNADDGDVGKTIDVRIHGARHATKPGLRLSIILAVMGVAVALPMAFLLLISTRSALAARGRPPESAASAS